jgi:hypothetical protein
VDAGSNSFTVALRVVGGDEKGSLKSETVTYGHKKNCAGNSQQHIEKTDPSSRKRRRFTKQELNCQTVINILGLDTMTY